VTDFGQGLESYALALMIQPDGRIIIAGESSYEFLVARYNSNGTLDTTFSNNGFALANFSSNWDGATDAVLQPDGKIVLVGWSVLNSPYDSFALVRFNSDGSFDQSFGNGGKVLMPDQGDLNAVALQSDGKLIALGNSNSTNSPFLLLRFDRDGALDTTFGSGGTITTSFAGPADGGALAFQADGKLVAGGLTSSDIYFQNSDFALARYLDSSQQAPTVVSRKTHGSSGTFDISLPLTGTPGIECRSGGTNSDYQVVFVFPSPVTVSGASVVPGPGKSARMAGAPLVSPDGRTVTLNLNSVSDAQTVGLVLTGVNNGTSTHDVGVQMSVFVGDTNGTGAITASDVSQTKARAGQAVTNSNFRSDVTANGAITASDLALVKSYSGSG
jgi:uncharacterized delta-60 repeat protein